MRCTTLKPSNVYLYIISSNINESIDRTVQSVVRRHVRIEDTRSPASKEATQVDGNRLWDRHHAQIPINKFSIKSMKNCQSGTLVFREKFQFKISRDSLFAKTVERNINRRKWQNIFRQIHFDANLNVSKVT